MAGSNVRSGQSIISDQSIVSDQSIISGQMPTHVHVMSGQAMLSHSQRCAARWSSCQCCQEVIGADLLIRQQHKTGLTCKSHMNH